MLYSGVFNIRKDRGIKSVYGNLGNFLFHCSASTFSLNTCYLALAEPLSGMASGGLWWRESLFFFSAAVLLLFYFDRVSCRSWSEVK